MLASGEAPAFRFVLRIRREEAATSPAAAARRALFLCPDFPSDRPKLLGKLGKLSI